MQVRHLRQTEQRIKIKLQLLLKLYGTEDKSLIARPALHSYAVHLRHPVTGEVLDVAAPMPEDMLRLLE